MGKIAVSFENDGSMVKVCSRLLLPFFLGTGTPLMHTTDPPHKIRLRLLIHKNLPPVRLPRRHRPQHHQMDDDARR